MPVDPTLTEPFVVGEDEVGGVAGIGGEAVADPGTVPRVQTTAIVEREQRVITVSGGAF